MNGQTHSVYLYPSKYLSQKMKKPINFDGMINKLRTRLVICEKDELKIKEFLSNHNYYRFSIFPKLLPEVDKKDNKYTFEDAFFLYDIDSYIKKKLYYFIHLVELQVKSSLVEYFVGNYNDQGFEPGEFHLDYQNYYRNQDIDKMKNIYSNCVQSSNSVMMKYHKEHKRSCVPFWVIVEEMTFGQIDTFVHSLLPKHRKEWINDQLSHNYGEVIAGWLSNIRELRNKTCHFARLYGAATTKSPKIKKTDIEIFKDRSINKKEMNRNKTRLFGYLYTMSKMMALQPSSVRREWKEFLEELDHKITGSNLVNLKILGLTEKWLEILECVHINTVEDLKKGK